MCNRRGGSRIQVGQVWDMSHGLQMKYAEQTAKSQYVCLAMNKTQKNCNVNTMQLQDKNHEAHSVRDIFECLNPSASSMSKLLHQSELAHLQTISSHLPLLDVKFPLYLP